MCSSFAQPARPRSKLLAAIATTWIAVAAAALAPHGDSQAAPGAGSDATHQDAAKNSAEMAQQPPAPSPFEYPLRVRTANEPLLAEARAAIEKARVAAERFAARTNKIEDMRAKSDAWRKEVVDAYQSLEKSQMLGTELLLRGELDGRVIQNQAFVMTAALDATVAVIRPALGTPKGLVNAVSRRAQEQIPHLKQLDDLVKQRKWTTAHTKAMELLDAADEVGRLVDPKESEPVFKPIWDRLAQIEPEYWIELKPTLVPSLREEFKSIRPDLATLQQKVSSLVKSLGEKKEIRWDGLSIDGAALLVKISELWPSVDDSVSQALAVVHAIGPAAETDFKGLQADYAAAHLQALGLARELILAETATLAPADVEREYLAYLSAIPPLTSALHASPSDLMPLATPLELLAAKSPALVAKIRRYRDATDDTLRWRRRLVQRQLKKLHEQGVLDIVKLLDNPPALPGQEGPGGHKRLTQTVWTDAASCEVVGGAWTAQWRYGGATVPAARIQWRAGGDPMFIAVQTHRVRCEIPFSRKETVALVESLAKDLLVGPDRPALTLEVAMALYTATFGPYLEVAGNINAAKAENLPDRLYDLHDPLDLPALLVNKPLVPYPNFPAMIRVEFVPVWLAHDLFVWTPAPPPSSTPSPPPAQRDPVAAKSPDNPHRPADADPGVPSGKPSTPSKAGGAGATDGDTGKAPSGDTTKKGDSKPNPPPAKGGTPF